MLITDLNYWETTIDVSEQNKTVIPNHRILGAASAYVAGYTSTGTGYASAGSLAFASGQQTYGTTNTLATTSLYPYYSTSSATASGRALGISPNSYASANLYSSSNNTSFNGSSMTMDSTVTYSTYRTR